MFGSLGFTEIAFILVLALLLFGPKRLPEIGRTLGKGLAEFRKASNDLRRSLENEVALDEEREKRRPKAVPAPQPAVSDGSDGAAASAATESGGSSESPAAGEPSATPEGVRPASRSIERAG